MTEPIDGIEVLELFGRSLEMYQAQLRTPREAIDLAATELGTSSASTWATIQVLAPVIGSTATKTDRLLMWAGIGEALIDVAEGDEILAKLEKNRPGMNERCAQAMDVPTEIVDHSVALRIKDEAAKIWAMVMANDPPRVGTIAEAVRHHVNDWPEFKDMGDARAGVLAVLMVHVAEWDRRVKVLKSRVVDFSSDAEILASIVDAARAGVLDIDSGHLVRVVPCTEQGCRSGRIQGPPDEGFYRCVMCGGTGEMSDEIIGLKYPTYPQPTEDGTE